jgi:RimJ/RimL family protein N-acetyltransferase
MGIALRHRGKGGGYAAELALETLLYITERAMDAGIDHVGVTALVFERNEPSQRWCRRIGMRHTGMASRRPLPRCTARRDAMSPVP